MALTTPGLRAAAVPPGPPTNLTAQVSGSTVVLNWSAPATGGTPTSYLLQTGSASGLSDLADTSTNSTLTTLTVPNVATGQYFVRVLAQDAAGTSAPSNEIVVTVPGSCTGVPGAPVALTAAVTGTSVAMAWHAPLPALQAERARVVHHFVVADRRGNQERGPGPPPVVGRRRTVGQP